MGVRLLPRQSNDNIDNDGNWWYWSPVRPDPQRLGCILTRADGVRSQMGNRGRYLFARLDICRRWLLACSTTDEERPSASGLSQSEKSSTGLLREDQLLTCV